MPTRRGPDAARRGRDRGGAGREGARNHESGRAGARNAGARNAGARKAGARNAGDDADASRSSRRGFACMSRERVREIASRGGRASAESRGVVAGGEHDRRRGAGGRRSSPSPRGGRSSKDAGDDRRGSSRRGFASMPLERVREIARRGGRASAERRHPSRRSGERSR
jgi:hypothetical protein